MPRGDQFSLMADEVMRDITEKGVGFNRAFSWAAHRRKVFWASQREQYNDWFAIVRERVSNRKKTLLKESLKGERPWQHGRPRKKKEASSVEIPPEPPNPWDTVDHSVYPLHEYDDNRGFLHGVSPYLDTLDD